VGFAVHDMVSLAEDTKLVIITGLSGAGKTETIRCFEDYGYFCVDNLPPVLLVKFAELFSHSDGKFQGVAIVCDIRGGEFFDDLFAALEELELMGYQHSILFLEASDEILIRRYKETRRRHPLSKERGISEGISEERRRLGELRGCADRIIDTSALSVPQLKAELTAYLDKAESDRLTVTCISFGFAKGIPLDADLVIDVRFLPNPFYVDSLKHLTGNDGPVDEYIFKWPITQRFMDKFLDFVSFLVPQYVSEGKTHLTIAVGCTGGRHRSVAVTNHLAAYVKRQGYKTVLEHRDI
jgi:UPF0042 nucleotide-binding protein